MSRSSFNNPYEIPDTFYEAIEPYVGMEIEQPQIPDTPEKLIAIWKSALAARRAYPEEQELIAEWAISAGARSPLINDNDIFEDIHARFGRLEVPDKDGNQAEWDELEGLIYSFPSS